MAYDWDRIRSNIFAGESGGDYNALFGYSNRPGGQFEGNRLTDMTVDQALQFANPSGPYGQWVKGKVGRVATPMGAYQIVGTTLRDAKNALGLRGDELMTPELQDRLGRWIYETQGTGAWEGYRPDGGARSVARDTMAALGKGPQMAQNTISTQQAQPQQKQGFLGGLLSDPDKRDRLIMALEGMTLNPNQALMQQASQGIQMRREKAQSAQQKNATADWLAKQGRTDLAEAVRTGAVPAMAAVQSAMAAPKDDRTALQKNYEFFIQQGLTPEQAMAAVKAGTTVNVGGAAPSAFQEAVDKKFADRYLDWKTTGSADTSQQVAQISSVLSKLEAGQELTGPTVAAIDAIGLGSIFTPEAKDAKERIESVVQRSLKETLGAQFTAKEGENLIRRAYNPALPPEMNAARLRALYMTLSAADKAKRAMIDYVDQNGTLVGYTGPEIPTAAEIEASMDRAAPSATGQSSNDLSDEELIKKYGG